MKSIKLLLISLLLVISGCSTAPVVKYENFNTIQIQVRPRAVEIEKLNFIHTVYDNKKYLSLDYDQVRTLLRNLSEIQRFTEQQSDLIKYYEDEVNELNKEFHTSRDDKK